MLTQTQSAVCEHTLATGASAGFLRFIVIGVLTGFTSSMFGTGGAPVIIFGLLWLCGYNMLETTGPSLATLSVSSIIGFSLRFYLQSSDFQLQMAMVMLPFGLAGVIAGHFAAKYWNSKCLQVCFSCLVVFIGLKMMGVSIFPSLPVPQGDMYWLLCGTAGLAGLGSRMFGTGGGLVTVPTLMYVGIAPHQTLITSLGLNLPMMLLGGTLNLWGKSPRWKELRYLIFGVIAGAPIGAYISYMYVPDILLQALFGGLLVASAAITMSTHILGTFRIGVPCMPVYRHESDAMQL